MRDFVSRRNALRLLAYQQSKNEKAGFSTQLRPLPVEPVQSYQANTPTTYIVRGFRAYLFPRDEDNGSFKERMLLHFRNLGKIKTKTVVYEETYYARDSGTLEQLKELSTRRKVIEQSVNGKNQLTPAIAREMAGGLTSPVLQDIQKLKWYLPLLENLVMCVIAERANQKIRQWTIDLKIRWTSVLSGSSGCSFGGTKYFRVDDLNYELSMVLFLYGALLRERAFELLSTDLVEAATLFRTAAGVYQHLGQNVLPALQPFLPPERPPECTASMASVLSIVCLAEAQAVTVRKAEEKSTSAVLLAKLHHGVAQLLEEASELLRANLGDWNDVSQKLRKYISICHALHEGRSRKFMADDFRQRERLGVANAILRHAVSEMHQISCPGNDDWKPTFKSEVNALSEMLKKCEHENDFIWRDKSPRQDELPVLEGKKIVTPIVYTPSDLDRDFVFVTTS